MQPIAEKEEERLKRKKKTKKTTHAQKNETKCLSWLAQSPSEEGIKVSSV